MGGINNDSCFEETHCNVCGTLNEDETSYTCPDCVKKKEELEERYNNLDMERDHITEQMVSLKEEIKECSP